MAASPKVLDDVCVLEVGGEIGSWCGKLLADMGATVIKVEPPTGDSTRTYQPFFKDEPGENRSLYFWHYNTSKQGVTLDISCEAGRKVFSRLASTSDVVIDSHPPGYLDSLGIGYGELEKSNPGLVMAAITPFGQNGPYKDYVMTDLTALAFGGPVWSCGYDDHSIPPVRGGGNQGYQTASHYAVTAIMIALIYRQHTGIGQFVDVNMHASVNVTTEGATYNWLVAKDTVQRQTGRHSAVRPTPASQVKCRDGRYVNVGIGARSEEQWIQLLVWLDEEGVVGDLMQYLTPPSREKLVQRDPETLDQQRKVAEAVKSLAAKMDAYDLFRKAQDLGFQWGIIYSPEDVLNDPHFQERGFPVEVEHPELDASFVYPGAPYSFSATPWAIKARAPLLGEHNEEVYVQRLGMTPGELSELKDSGVI